MPLRRTLGRSAAQSLVRLFSRFSGGSATSEVPTNIRRSLDGATRISRAVGYGLETLERRVLLTTIGFDTLTNTPIPDGTIEYSQGQPANLVRVAWHNIVAELIGVSVPVPAGDPAPTPPDQPSSGVDLLPAQANAPDFAPNLFTIYIASSKPDSWLTIGAVPALTARTRPMQPFGGGVTLRVTAAAGTDPIIAVTAGPGSVLIGQRHTGPTDKGDGEQPIWTAPATGPLGVFPGTNGAELVAGVIMAPTSSLDGTPNDIGELLIGGTILGAVNIPRAGTASGPGASEGGNVGLLYAGALLTGTASGLFQGENPNNLLTTGGVPPTSASDLSPSFIVGGDIRDLIVNGSLGGDSAGAARPDSPRYITGTRLVVGGSVGQIRTLADNYGSFDIQHLPGVKGLPHNLYGEFEFEYKISGQTAAGDVFQGGLIFDVTAVTTTNLNGLLPPRLTILTNDTPDTAQLLGSVKATNPVNGAPLVDGLGRFIYISEVTGSLQDFSPPSPRDVFDWYAVPLMAGQTITVTPTTGQLLMTEVMDPDGRIIATDESKSHPAATLDKPFSFTTDRPGLYRFGVTDLPGIVFEGQVPYTLQISGVGDMGLAAVSSDTVIYDAEFDKSIQLDNGDLGALLAATHLISDTLGPTPAFITDPISGLPIIDPTVPAAPPTSYLVDAGNLRVMRAGSIGFTLAAGTPDPVTGVVVAGAFGDIPIIDVPNGSVGLVNAIGGVGPSILALQTRFDLNDLTNANSAVSPIGGSFQRISGAAGLNCYLQIAADGGIGTIAVDSMSTSPASFIQVNADNTGNDGIIDLIDVTGSMGDLGPGGPGFMTGAGGDIRFMRVGGPIFKDNFFGGTQIIPTTAAVMAPVTFTDDSGNTLNFTPAGLVTNTIVLNPDGSSTTVQAGPQISYTTYPVRDKGGQVPITVACTGGLTISSSGVSGTLSRSEIGSVTFLGQGAGLQISAGFDSFGNTVLFQQAASTVATILTFVEQDLTINGPAAIDILDVIDTTLSVTAPAGTITGSISSGSIFQNTKGDLINITTSGDLNALESAGDIGIATPRATASAILPNAVLFTAYPFNQQHTGLTLAGNVLNLTANGAIGNIQAAPGTVVGNFLSGTIQTLIANADNVVLPGHYDGIVGNVLTSRILTLNVGQGVLPSGNGEVSFAGIYATRKIGTVVGSGSTLTYIRGNIVVSPNATNVNDTFGLDAAGNTVTGLVSAIDTISITGSIINAAIGTFGTFADLITTTAGTSVPIFIRPVGVGPQFDVGPIKIFGRGGIIGSLISSYTASTTAISPQGFGILNSGFQSVADGHRGIISAGGYGIRGTFMSFGADLAGLVAYGNGSLLPVTVFPSDLIPSISGIENDPFFISPPDLETDLFFALGVTPAAPNVPNVTDTGVIQDVVAQGSGIFGTLQAQKVRTSLPLFTPTPLPFTSKLNIPELGVTYPMSLSFGSGVQNLMVRGVIDGLQITAGHLGGFFHNGSVSRVGISIAGPVGTFSNHGNVGQIVTDPTSGNPIPDSYIQASGASGFFTSVYIAGSLFANVTANAHIGVMKVLGDLQGVLTINGQSNGLALNSLTVGGAIRDGALNIQGNVGSIATTFGLGTTAGSLTINGSLQRLVVGTSHSPGNVMALSLHVTAGVGAMAVFGRIDGNVNIDSDLTNFKVMATAPGNAINGAITIGGKLGAAAVIGGNIAGNVSVNSAIGNFVVNHGSVLNGATISSQIDTIRAFKIVGGKSFGLLGNLSAPNSVGGLIDISGNLGDGINAANINAASGTTFRIRGSILAAGNISVAGQLNLLYVDGNINSGATVSAHPLKQLIVVGSNTGTITTV